MEPLTLYPNPASDRITVKGLGNVAYQIFSIHGKLISEGVYTGQIELNRVEAGTYILRSEDGRAARFMKF